MLENYDLEHFFFKGNDAIALMKALDIRKRVFIEEQGIEEKDDLDGKDRRSVHLLVLLGTKPVGTARLRKIGDHSLKLERFAVLKEFRGIGIGKNMIYEIEEYARKMNIERLILDAQMYVKGFYEKLGYSVCSKEFYEAGILHVRMIKRLIEG
ncbi:MAG: N-acetyltransferase [Thermotoga sp.]|nr:MAG: N-acetyltransferase [Thermotoga sp.]